VSGAHPKTLGPVTLLALGINGIVGAGIFVAPPIVARAFPGPIGAVVYVAIAVACLPVALAYARLARAMPTDGGPALYARRAFGPSFAQAIGVVVWVSALFSTAAVTRALCEQVARGRAVSALAAVLCFALAVVNLRGLRLSAMAWTVLTVAKLVPLAVLAGFGFFSRGSALLLSIPEKRGAALLAILFALQGFEIVPLPAGQVRDPERTVPRATLASLVCAGILYAIVHLACVRALPSLATVQGPIPAAAMALGGSTLAKGISAGVVASIGGIVVGMHAMTPRYLSALGSAPEAAVPVRSIVATAVFVASLCLFSSLGTLLDLSSVAVLVQYGTTALALLVLSFRRLAGLVPRDAWPAPFALAVVVVLLVQAPPRDLGLAALVAALGIAFARAFSRPASAASSRTEPPAR
jgi:amino acid transporter